jgi:hypothetical protein
MVVTSVKTYQKGKLSEAMKAVADEANAAGPKGYVLLGFQVVESEKVVVALYRQGVGAQPLESPLVGE